MNANLCCPNNPLAIHYRCNISIMSNNQIINAFKTLKSANEKADLNLLKRLSALNIKRDSNEVKPEREQENTHRITSEKLDQILCRHISDPLTWNPSVLSRIYDIPLDTCVKIFKYVKPFAYRQDNTVNSTQKILPISFVIDVERLKEDKSYYPGIQKLSFVAAPLNPFAITEFNS